ncbi:hypothetical protein [Pseudolysinimonas kribbensis]|uniref:hypothetical protein n=1 Tax=Pseudolysinimonas kribbensis TaxID=433641 RepID=UPI0024E09C4D|nr:hypothetical protein [Pseudolysinimonas kribbensis]
MLAQWSEVVMWWVLGVVVGTVVVLAAGGRFVIAVLAEAEAMVDDDDGDGDGDGDGRVR